MAGLRLHQWRKWAQSALRKPDLPALGFRDAQHASSVLHALLDTAGKQTLADWTKENLPTQESTVEIHDPAWKLQSATSSLPGFSVKTTAPAEKPEKAGRHILAVTKSPDAAPAPLEGWIAVVFSRGDGATLERKIRVVAR